MKSVWYVLLSSVSVSALKWVTVTVLVSSVHSGIDLFFSGLYAVCSLLYLLIPSTLSLYRLYHFEDELCADLEALAELIAVGEIMQFNVR